ncbi:MAG: lipocalin family protein [Bacteroidales bacterium]
MTKKIIILIIGIILILIGFTLKGNNKTKSIIDKTVVKDFDLNRYLGTWYEIARYDHRFEKDMVGVTANYSMREDGKVKVVNSGYKGSFSGEFSEAIGKAKIPNPEKAPAKLKVAFFLFFYGDYYILDIDPNYQWAIIGSSSDNYLWILSRTSKIDDNLYNSILKKIDKRGYDITKLIKVKQK